jgi:hypothetical protein
MIGGYSRPLAVCVTSVTMSPAEAFGYGTVSIFSEVAISKDSCLPAGRRGHNIFAFCAQISLIRY